MYVFNKKNFLADLDKVRKRKGLTWNKVAIRAGIHPSTLVKFIKQIDNNNVCGMGLDTFVALLGWMKQVDVTEYIDEE